jgi:heme/copper-type cytochrome/quinol oxidase subunit 2
MRCAELCGLWHGSMAERGEVMSATAWNAWIAKAQSANAPATSYLPKYAHVYYPLPLARAG